MKRAALFFMMAVSLSGCGIFGGKGKPKTPVLGERLPVLAYEGALELDPALAGVQVSLPPPVENASWTQPGGSSEGAIGNVALAASPSRAWQVSIGRGTSGKARLASGPVIDGGNVFTIDTAAEVRAFSAATGRQLWRYEMDRGGDYKRTAFGGGVGAGDGKLFAVSGFGRVVALEQGTGRRLWEVDLQVPLRGAPAVAGGQIFILSQDNQLFALSVLDGSTQWDMAATVENTSLFGAATPAVSQGTIVAGFSAGELIALRVENGRVVWQDALARTGISTSVGILSDIDASPAIDQGRVFAVGKGGRMAALELNTGQRVWEVNMAGAETPVPSGDWVFTITDEAQVVCLSRATGKVRWMTQLRAFGNEKKKTKPINWSGPVLADGKLIVVSSRGQMVTLSAEEGTVQREVKLGGDAMLSPVVANGALYVLTEDGKLSAWR